jgi:Ca2+-binding EF-hand superfamily protein
MKSTKIRSLVVSGLALCAVPFALAGGDGDKFTKMDKDGDGKVTKTEHSSGAQDMFAALDANRDNIVTAAEMDAKKADKPAAAGTVAALSAADKIKEIDKDGDGKLTSQEHSAGSEAMFARMDTNGDGSLSKEEFDAGHKAKRNT